MPPVENDIAQQLLSCIEALDRAICALVASVEIIKERVEALEQPVHPSSN